MRSSFFAVLASIALASSSLFAQADSLDKPPAWYKGEKPWTSISREGRLEILKFRRAYEAQDRKAREPSARPSTPNAADGKAFLGRIVTKYRLDDFYRHPDTFGGRMVIWIPEKEWAQLTKPQKASLEAYMSASYTHYGIGTGRIKGREILFDRLVVER